MPVRVEKKGDKYRVVESSGRIAKTKKGNPVDGGGHLSRNKAIRQAASINRGSK